MRKGQNPAKAGVQAYTPKKLGIASLVSIPVLEGYFAHSLEIFKIHLASIRQYTAEPFDLFVFDNGSCDEVKNELVKLSTQGVINTLILSRHNLGKTAALNQLLGAMHNDWICFSDSDMLFRPGWLEASWEINENFPGCGMIGAQVVFPDRVEDKGNTAFRQDHPEVYQILQEKADPRVVKEYIRGRGINEKQAKYYKEMLLDKAVNTSTGVEAYMGGNSHGQFLGPRDVLLQLLPLPSGLQLSREQDTYQDRRIDELGYLHLTTTVPYIYHMGNVLDPEIVVEVNKLRRLLPASTAVRSKARRKTNLSWKILVQAYRIPFLRKMMLRLYNNLYEIISN
jgi:glycosyltransferase involved in cell wall biosynthesis